MTVKRHCAIQHCIEQHTKAPTVNLKVCKMIQLKLSVLTCTDKYSGFKGYFPGKRALISSPVDLQSPVILTIYVISSVPKSIFRHACRDSHFPGKPGLRGSPVDSSSSVIRYNTIQYKHLYCAQWSTTESNLRHGQSPGGQRWLCCR